MKKVIYHITNTIWLLLILISGSQRVFSQNELSITIQTERELDVCDSSKEVILLVNVGNLTSKDSVYGFDFMLKYDKKKLLFTDGIYSSTLAEYLDFKGTNFYTDTIRCYGMTNGKNPIIGSNMPLIAILGTFNSNCPDSTLIKMIDFEVGDKKIKMNDFNLKMIVKDIPQRYLQCKLSKYLVDTFDNDSLVKIALNVALDSKNTTPKLSEINFNLSLDKVQNVKIHDIESADTNVQIIDKNKTDFGYDVKLKINGDNKNIKNLLNITMKELNKAKDSLHLNIKAVSVNDCACITKLLDTSALIITKDSVRLIVDDSKEIINWNYNSLTKELCIDNSNSDFNGFELFNLQGMSVLKTDISDNTIKSVDMTSYPNGAYVLTLKKNNIYKKKIIIVKI